MLRPPHRLCGPAAGGTVSRRFAPVTPQPLGRLAICRMDPRIGLAVYLLIAAAAGFVTASRNLPLPVLFLVIIALGVVAVLIRRQVLGLGGTTRVAIAFLAVYLLTFFLVRFLDESVTQRLDDRVVR